MNQLLYSGSERTIETVALSVILLQRDQVVATYNVHVCFLLWVRKYKISGSQPVVRGHLPGTLETQLTYQKLSIILY